ncbi:sigma-54 dependent transcriptional regulator [candidate division KSB1 bacterium]|nr:sigma-54 dependent transcriptional regulator [candidate division KSB1 bacterium]
MKTTILIVDDNAGLRETFGAALSAKYETRLAATVDEGKARLEDGEVDLVLLDLHLQARGLDRSGFEILKWIRSELARPIGVIMFTVEEDVSTVVEAMKLGADDYLSKNCSDDELLVKVEKAIANLRAQRAQFVAEQQSHDERDRIIGEAPALKKVLAQADKLADKDGPVLILGETGAGKELIARRLHEQSWRKKHQQPFVAINCATIPESIAESELFGHERGAFTGAQQRRVGKFEWAGQGTIFLDELDCLPLELQTKLLRALEDKVFERLGGNRQIRLRARLVAAAKSDLPQAVEAGNLRTDLYYRLKGVTLGLPPLRNRLEDVPLLVDYFLKKFNRKNGLTIETIEESAMQALLAYRWPGNVRELRRELERIFDLSEPGTRHIQLDMLSENIRQAAGAASQPLLVQTNESLTLHQAKSLLQRQMVDEAMRQANNNITKAAEKLGLTRRGLQKILLRQGKGIDDGEAAPA